MKLCITTVNNNFLLLPKLCQKELHLRCFIGLELNIAFTIIENSKRCRGTPPWSSATLGTHEKLNFLDALKMHFQRFFPLSFLHLKLVSAFLFFIFSPDDSPSKVIKDFFHFIEKALFVLEMFKFFLFFSALSRFKRTNGSRIIYDAMNWLAKICRFNFWNSS